MDNPAFASSVPPAGFWRRLGPVPFLIISLMGIFVLYQGIAGGATLLLAGVSLSAESVHAVRWATLLGQLLTILLPTLILARLRYGSVLQPLRVRVPDPLLLILAIAGAFALQQVLQGYLLAQDQIPMPDKVRKMIDMIKELFEQTYRLLLTAHSPVEFLMVVATVAIVPALAEEFLFRGLAQRALEETTTGLKPAVISGVIFGLYHLHPFSLVALIAIGIFLGWLVHVSNNLSIAILAHFFNNFLAALSVHLALDENFLVLAPNGGADAGVVVLNTLVFALVLAGVMYLFVRRAAGLQRML